MGLSTDRIPNRPLNGSEVMEYVLHLVREYGAKYAGTIFKASFTFVMRSTSLPKYDVTGEIPVLESETPAGALEALIAQSRSRMEKDWVFGRNLTYPQLQYVITLRFKTESGAISVRELTGRVDNPNLVRVHYDLPIVNVEKVLPTPEQPMGGLKHVTMTFDRAEYPPPATPVEVNLTPEVDAIAEPATVEEETASLPATDAIPATETADASVDTDSAKAPKRRRP